MSNTFDKLSILDSFIEEVKSYLPEIEANLEHLAQSPADMESLEETYRRTHTIGGSASMMDFPGLAHVARGMEDILSDALEGIISLDPLTIGLLQRSQARMHRLLEGIRDGVDEKAVIAQDDADYMQYRAQSDSAVNEGIAGYERALETATPLPHEEPLSSSMPTLDEVLASFRTPSLVAGEELAWPEEPMPASDSASSANQNTQPERDIPHEFAAPSALDLLVATTRPPSPSAYSVPPITPKPSLIDEETIAVERDIEPQVTSEAIPVQLLMQDAEHEASGLSFSKAFNEMQDEAKSLEVQTASLKSMLSQLRVAMSIIEAQRSEYKGFLDGSKDALDRIEEWAGEAMGLNLRHSPDQVRRYLPLSVMWVTNSKLKKVLDLLTQITSGVEMTDERIQSIITQLYTSIASCGDVFKHIHEQEAIFSPVKHEREQTLEEKQASYEAESGQEHAILEPRYDLVALRAEIEAGVREELRQEYESRPLTLAARSEIEQQIRNEMRQEFELKRQLQERVAGSEYNESLQQLENHLRSEIEIEVRQEFLEQIIASGGDSENPSIQTLMPPAVRGTQTSNYIEQVRKAAGLGEADSSASALEAYPRTLVTPTSATPSTAPMISQETHLHASAFSGDFGEEASEIFQLEAEEHLQTISLQVTALENDPTNRDLLQSIRRTIHTLKGAAGMMGFHAIADLCHISEDLLDSVMEGTTAVTASVLSIVIDTVEALDMLITSKGIEHAGDEVKLQSLRERYVDLLGERTTTLDSFDEDFDMYDTADASILEGSAVVGVIAGTKSDETQSHATTERDLSVRVRLQKLDELVNLFGELLVNRSVLEERIGRLYRLVADVGVSSVRLRDVGQKLDSRFEAATLPSGRSVQVMPGEGNQSRRHITSDNGKTRRLEPSHLEEFDELELDRYTEFHQLARGLSEGISDMTTLSFEMDAVIRECEGVFAREHRLSTIFQDRLMKTRLVPLSTMVPRLYRAARAVALKQQKEFEFLLEGVGTEVDRTVNEEIAGPLLHLIRNAVNHAIETPEVRLQKGKLPVGQIKLSAAYDGNQVVITVRDDGTGIDPEQVRNTAIARGLIQPDQMLNDDELIGLIFRPGFSTAEVLSEESGRGVGLDVVRDSVSRLRGTVEVESIPGQGTAFTMRFPTSLAIQSTMMVQVGDQQFAIPTVMVEAIGRLDNFKRSRLDGTPAIIVRDELYPLVMLAEYLALPVSSLEEKAPILLINTGGQRVALVVGEIKGKSDVVMKSLGPHLQHVRGVAGGTIMGNGRVVLILDLLELLSSQATLVTSTAGSSMLPRSESMAGATAHAHARPAIATTPSQQYTASAKPPEVEIKPEQSNRVLVVDDSPSVRRVISNMLKQHGWEVQLARDGLEALEMISREMPAAVLLDLEMPRMDGYELIATLRAQEQYQALPIIVLTSRAAAKHQQRAMQLGASSYLVKPYQDEELNNTLKKLVYGAAMR